MIIFYILMEKYIAKWDKRENLHKKEKEKPMIWKWNDDNLFMCEERKSIWPSDGCHQCDDGSLFDILKSCDVDDDDETKKKEKVATQKREKRNSI